MQIWVHLYTLVLVGVRVFHIGAVEELELDMGRLLTPNFETPANYLGNSVSSYIKYPLYVQLDV